MFCLDRKTANHATVQARSPAGVPHTHFTTPVCTKYTEKLKRASVHEEGEEFCELAASTVLPFITVIISDPRCQAWGGRKGFESHLLAEGLRRRPENNPHSINGVRS